MFKVDGDTISITRGDTGVFSLNITTAQGHDYDYSNDSVVFTVKKSIFDTEPLIQKQVVYGENIVIEPEDTNNFAYATYWYDVQVTTEEGVVDTIIPPSKFIVMPEVTF